MRHFRSACPIYLTREGLFGWPLSRTTAHRLSELPGRPRSPDGRIVSGQGDRDSSSLVLLGMTNAVVGLSRTTAHRQPELGGRPKTAPSRLFLASVGENLLRCSRCASCAPTKEAHSVCESQVLGEDDRGREMPPHGPASPGWPPLRGGEGTRRRVRCMRVEFEAKTTVVARRPLTARHRRAGPLSGGERGHGGAFAA